MFKKKKKRQKSLEDFGSVKVKSNGHYFAPLV